jgi:hypothetical protein
MMDPVRAMAERARREPYFLGWVLERYAQAERLDEAGLAAALGCEAVALTDLRLCRAPRLDPAGLTEDVRRIAEVFRLDAGQLLAIVKRAAVLGRLQDAPSPDGRPTYLMAARDREEGEG